MEDQGKTPKPVSTLSCIIVVIGREEEKKEKRHTVKVASSPHPLTLVSVGERVKWFPNEE